MPTYEQVLMNIIQNSTTQMRAAPINLGGVSSAGGGVGGPPGGFVGVLPQTRVAYDTTESGIATTSGVPSLFDNLNHIRYRLQQLEEALLKLDILNLNLSNPPSNAELSSGIGNPVTFSGYTAVVNISGLGNDEYLVFSDGSNWFYTSMTKAT